MQPPRHSARCKPFNHSSVTRLLHFVMHSHSLIDAALIYIKRFRISSPKTQHLHCDLINVLDDLVNLIFLGAYWVKDILWLRLLAMVGSLASIPYYLLQTEERPRLRRCDSRRGTPRDLHLQCERAARAGARVEHPTR
jgi:hypothetical protein